MINSEDEKAVEALQTVLECYNNGAQATVLKGCLNILKNAVTDIRALRMLNNINEKLNL